MTQVVVMVPDEMVLTYANDVFVETFRLPAGQKPRREMHMTDERTNSLLHYTGPDGQAVTGGSSVDPSGKLRFVAAEVQEAAINNARDFITADAIDGTLAKYYLPFPEAFTTATWKQYRLPSGAPTIERAWDNEDGSVETVAARLWGQNPAQGPGNYLVVRARLFPGSPHHAARTLFPS